MNSTKEKTEKTNSKITKITLKELGAIMPLGILTPDGSYAKSFGVRRWRMKEERELGELRDTNRSDSVGQFVARVISSMCTTVGIHDFDKLKEPEKLVHISQMFCGDVFYLYVWLRLNSLGKTLNVSIKCPNCSHNFKFGADLETLEIDVCEKYEDALWEYKLEYPFKIRNKETKSFTMGPPRWSTLESMKGIGGMNTGGAKAGMILGSIVGINGEKEADGKPKPIVLSLNELDEMDKTDIEGLTKGLDDYAIGPNMSIDGECPRCRSNYIMPIDWSYDGFFGASSR